MCKATESKTDHVKRLTDLVQNAARAEYGDYGDLLENDELGSLTKAVRQLIGRLREETSAREKAEQMLQTAEPLLSTVLPTIQDSFTIIDPSLTITYVNQTAEEHFKACMPLVGRKCYEAFHNRTDPCEACLAEQAFTTGVASYRQSHYSGPAGEWYDVYYFPLKDPESGKIRGVLSYARDITERKRAEAALRESEERFRNLMDNMPGVAVQGYKTDGTVVYWNKASEAVYGYSREEALGKNLEDLVVPTDLKPLFRECLVLGKQARESGEFMPSGELLLLRKDGRPTPVYSMHMAVVLEGKETILYCLDLNLSERKRAEEALRVTNETLNALLEAAPVAIVGMDPQGTITQWNRTAEQMFGWARTEAIGHFTPYVPESKHQEHETMRARVLSGEVIQNVEVQRQKKDESSIDISVSAAPIRSAKGDVVGMVGVNVDITKRKEAEKALAKSEQRFRGAFEQAAVGMAHVAPDYRFLRVNHKLCSIVGYTEEELLKRSFLEITHPDDRPRNKAMHDAMVAGECNACHLEKRYLHKNGSSVWVNITVTDLRSPSEEGNYFMTVVEDISARKQAEEKLRESEERFRHLADLLPEGIYELNSQGKISYANPSALEHFGYAPSDLEKGFSAADVVIPSQCEIARANVQKVLLGGETTLTEYTGLRKDGSTFPIMLHSAPVIREGKIVGARGICLNMSQQKHLEAQLVQAQKMECVGRLAGGVAHDFNNMLAIMLGSAELLQARLPGDDPLQDLVAEIANAALRSKDITSQLLAFSRKQIITPKPLNLNKVILAVGKTLSRLIGEDIMLRVHAGKDVWTIKADPTQIDQVLMNLAVNARDAMPHGGKLMIETANALLDEAYCQKHPGARPGAYVMLRVSDNGAGMDEEVLSHLFEPFFTTKEAGKGTGLGLATVYGIVKQNDGFIDVLSAPGQGSKFEIFLPRLTEKAGAEEIIEKGAKSYETGTILLVEDNAMVRDITTAMLETIGHTVLAVTTPEEALKLCQKESLQIDLLLTDVVLPEMSGKELKERLEITRPGINTLFMSGYPADVIGRHGILEPGTYFIQKPFKIDELREKVQEVMKKAPK